MHDKQNIQLLLKVILSLTIKMLFKGQTSKHLLHFKQASLLTLKYFLMFKLHKK